MSDTPILPALTAEEWNHPERQFEREGFWYYEPAGTCGVVGSADIGVGIPDSMVAPLIAALNGRLDSDDPRKITWATIGTLHSAANAIQSEFGPESANDVLAIRRRALQLSTATSSSRG